MPPDEHFQFDDTARELVAVTLHFTERLLESQTLRLEENAIIHRAVKALRIMPRATARLDVSYGLQLKIGGPDSWSRHTCEVSITEDSVGLDSSTTVYEAAVGHDNVQHFSCLIEKGGSMTSGSDPAEWLWQLDRLRDEGAGVFARDNSQP